MQSVTYWPAYIKSDSHHPFTCVCSRENRGRNTVEKQKSQRSCRGDTLPSTNILDERASLSLSVTWEALTFWGSNFFLCSPCSPCVWVETCLNEERLENMGFEEEIKQPKTSHFLEFRCLWNFKRNDKGHVFKSWSFPSLLGLPHFPQDPPWADPQWVYLKPFGAAGADGRQDTIRTSKNISQCDHQCDMSWALFK